VHRDLAGNVAPIHPGSIPSPGVGASSVAQLALQSRTSVGGGISPVLMAQVVTIFITISPNTIVD
jgi:hypothetical protein